MLNIAHIHSRGHGSMRTSEDYGEMFDLVRETIGTKEFYCHFPELSTELEMQCTTLKSRNPI